MEIEIKIKIEDPAAIKQKILAQGGRKREAGEYHDIYFMRPGFEENVLRLRTNSKDTMLTYKEPSLDPSSHVMERVELQTTVDRPEQMDQIIRKLGFVPHQTKDKKYENYDFDGVVVEFHTLPFLGEFIEIEAPEEKLMEVLPKLGLSIGMGLNKGYNRLFEDYKQEHGLADDVQDTFEDAKRHSK